MTDLPRPVPPRPLIERARGALASVDVKAVGGWLIAAVAVAVAVVVAVGVLRAGDGTVPPELSMPRAGSVGDPGGAGGQHLAGDPGTAAGSSASSGLTEVYVHVAGAVARPGLYRLPARARVADAVEAAGGALADADVDQVNLAALVNDGERVYVPRRGEAATTGSAGAASTGSAASRAEPLNLNTATTDQLDTLPGVGPSTARAIVEYRTRHGRFRSVDDLLEVRGIGPAKLEQLRPLVRV